jgi:ABC-type transporter Mla subunit MlaD
MVGWLTALLLALVTVASLSVREHATFQAATPSGEAEINSVDTDYQTLIDTYSTNYKSYVKNQDTASKAASDAAETHLQGVLDTMRRQINQNQMYIQTFLDEYEDTNPELDALHSKAQVLKKQGPKIADELATSQAETPTTVDYGALTIRIVVLMIIMGVSLAFNAYA